MVKQLSKTVDQTAIKRSFFLTQNFVPLKNIDLVLREKQATGNNTSFIKGFEHSAIK